MPMESDPCESQRRVLDYSDGLLDCEHTGSEQAESEALHRSAEAIEYWEENQNPAARRRMLEQVGRQMMDVHEAPPGPLVPRPMAAGEQGAYDDDAFRTDLNEQQLAENDPTDALETYLHEYRHAEQHYEVLKSHGPGRPGVNIERADALDYNLAPQHYIRPGDDFEAYRKQLAEADAERFGVDTAERILEQRGQLRDGVEKAARRRLNEMPGEK